MSALEDYLMQSQPVNPVQYSDEARKRALWQGVLQAGLAMMADQGKVYRTAGEARGSGISSLGKAGMAGLQGYNESLDADLKAQQANELMGLRKLAAMQKASGDFKTATIKKIGPDGKEHYYTMDNKTGGYTIDQGQVPPETFKDTPTFQVGMIDNQAVPIRSNANSKQMEYWDIPTKGWKTLDRPFTLTNQLLSPQDAAMLGIPYGSTKTGAAGMGLAAIPPAKRETLSGFDQAGNIIDNVEKYSGKVNTFDAGPAGLGRAYHGVANYVGGKTQSSPDVTMLQNETGKLSLLIRALGEKGALAEGDVQRGLDNIPTEFDIKAVAQQKIKDLKELFASNKQNLLTSLTTPITSGKPKSRPDPLGLRK